MKQNRRSVTCILVVTILLVLLVSVPQVFSVGQTEGGTEVEAPFYEGETITCIVPYGPGGGTDTFFRTVIEFWPKHIPGEPTMIIQNMSGAGGMSGNNYVYESAKPDGMTILTAPWLSMAQLTQQPGARVKYDEMGFIGGQGEPIVFFGRSKSPAEMLEADEIKLGGLRSSSNKDLRNLMALELLGVDFKYISGFKGGAAVETAVLRGEIDAFSANYSAWKARLESTMSQDDAARALWYFPIFDSQGNPMGYEAPDNDGIARLDKVYEEIHGEAPSGEMWENFKWFMAVSTTFGLSAWTPPGTPPEALEALRAGWYALEEDPEFIDAAVKRFGMKQIFVDLELGEAIIEQYIGNPDAEKIQFFQDLIEKYKQ